MKVTVEHNFTQETAIDCAENIFKNLSEKFKDEFSNLQQTRNDNEISFSFKIRGMNVSGKMTITENDVTVESKLPFAARMFQGMIENKIKENAEKMMAECEKNN
ncbi:MAG: hypothetical protein GXO49_07085 [Chlorobi bacterium]|nr:hypothetical protein [Chlorobiota bacterium]